MTTAINPLKELARDLLQNHFDVSLFNNKSAYAEIFGDSAIYKSPSRNVLIIGAGASKNCHEKFKLSREILMNLCFKQLKLDSLITSSRKLTLKFREEASKAANHRFAEWNTVDKILENLILKLPFENCLQLFAQFTTKEDLAVSLKRSVIGQDAEESKRIDALKVFEHLPCLLYEIIAHLFKHRYFDVIINMNFDEMLDNAIEDEMGDSTYFKVVNDADVKRLSQIVDGRRLRIPIYIKPHGTFSSYDSLRFTHDRYLTQPTPLNALFDDIFSGSTEDPKFSDVKRINITTVGYSFSDIDIQTPIFEQYAKSYRKLEGYVHRVYHGIEELNFYIFNISDDCKQDILNSFERWFSNEFPKYNLDDAQKKIYTTIRNDLEKSIKVIKPDAKHVDMYSGSFGRLFEELYDEIEKSYDKTKPYKPKGVARHKLVTNIFNKKYVEDGLITVDAYLNDTPHDFFHKLASFYAIYTLIKFKGHIPLNEITHNRPGKYFSLYLESLEGHPDYSKLRHDVKPNMIEYLKRVANNIGCDIVRTSGYINFVSANGNRKWDDFLPDLFTNIANQITKRSNGEIPLIEAIDIVKELQKDVMGKNRREINSIYNDKKHGFFSHFKQSCIINTNLEFTYRFFSIASKDDWYKLCMIDNSGKPIYNLYNYSSEADCRLTKLKNREVYLLTTSDDRSGFDRRYDVENIDIIEKIKSILGDNFRNEMTSLENNVHKMALFLDQKNNPLYGIYFFQPSTKARVNPVFFDKISNEHNLKIMLDLFLQCVPEKWKDSF